MEQKAYSKSSDNKSRSLLDIGFQEYIDKMWDTEVERVDLLAQLAVERKHIVIHRDLIQDEDDSKVTTQRRPREQRVSEPEIIIENTTIDLENLNSEAIKAISEAKNSKGEHLYNYFETVIRKQLQKRLKFQFDINEDEFNDIEQTTFEKILKNIQKFNFSENGGEQFTQLSGFINRVAINTVIDQHKGHNKTRMNEISLDESFYDSTDGGSGTGQMQVDSGIRVEEQVENTFEANIVKQAILNSLTDEQRNVFIMKSVLDYTTEEIAKILDINQGAIRAVHMRAAQSLQRILEGKI